MVWKAKPRSRSTWARQSGRGVTETRCTASAAGGRTVVRCRGAEAAAPNRRDLRRGPEGRAAGADAVEAADVQKAAAAWHDRGVVRAAIDRLRIAAAVHHVAHHVAHHERKEEAAARRLARLAIADAELLLAFFLSAEARGFGGLRAVGNRFGVRAGRGVILGDALVHRRIELRVRRQSTAVLAGGERRTRAAEQHQGDRAG